MASEKARILIGATWFRCVVERVDDIPHWSGRSIRRYACRLPNGNVICCGRNSIRFPTPTQPERTEDGK